MKQRQHLRRYKSGKRRLINHKNINYAYARGTQNRVKEDISVLQREKEKLESKLPTTVLLRERDKLQDQLSFTNRMLRDKQEQIEHINKTYFKKNPMR